VQHKNLGLFSFELSCNATIDLPLCHSLVRSGSNAAFTEAEIGAERDSIIEISLTVGGNGNSSKESVEYFMKRKNKRMKLLIFILVLGLCGCEYDRPGSNIFKARTLEKGMSVNQVKEIMGTPDDSLAAYNEKDNFMFIYETSFFVDDDIYVYIDSSKKVVTRIIFPKGY